jgi:hypothetical protein
MSDERGFGIDMVPMVGHDDAWGELYRSTCDGIQEQALLGPGRIPTTEAERQESVNADILRRACHVRMTELIEHVRRLDPRGVVVVANIVRLAAQDLEIAVGRYLAVEREFRHRR